MLYSTCGAYNAHLGPRHTDTADGGVTVRRANNTNGGGGESRDDSRVNARGQFRGEASRGKRTCSYLLFVFQYDIILCKKPERGKKQQHRKLTRR